MTSPPVSDPIMQDNSGAVVLIVEDEAIIAMDLQDSLEVSGFTVVMASSCSAAEMYLSTQRPVAAVIDIHLRDGDCVNVAKSLMKNGVPFVVHSGSYLPDQHEVFRAGILVTKPSDTASIVEVIRSLVTGNDRSGAG